MVLLLLGLASCDPGMRGDLRVFNESDQVLTVRTVMHNNDDTLSAYIAPHTDKVVVVLGGLGDKSKVDCCPCTITFISISSSSGPIKKSITNGSNWIIPNRSKLKRFGKEPIKCEFHVTQSDL